MKHVNKIAAILALSLLSVGCNNEEKINQITHGPEKVVIVDENSQIKVTDLQTLFDNLFYKTNNGPAMAVEVVMQHIAELEIAENNRSGEIETRINEKLVDIAKNTSYLFDGKFDEELLAADLNRQGFLVTCTNGHSDDVEDLKCDYTDYKQRNLRKSVLREMLNEQYILDEKATLIRDRRIREVEYISLTYTDKTKNKAIELMADFETRLLENPNLDFEEFATEWKDYRKSLIDEEVAKIGTDQDKDKTILNKYTSNNAYSIERGVELAKKAIDDVELVVKKTLSFTSSNSQFDSNTNNKIRNNEYRVIDEVRFVTAHYEDDKDGSIVINYSTNSQYQIIRVLDVIDNTSEDASKIKAARLLAQTSTNVRDAVKHYLEKYNVTVHDQTVADYLKGSYSFEAK